MKFAKNISDDKCFMNLFNEKGEQIDIKPIEVEKVITIPLDEYKSLLITSGKYLELKDCSGIFYIHDDKKNIGGEDEEI